VESPLCPPDDAEFRLIETFAVYPDRGAPKLARHLDRMGRSAQVLGLRFDRDATQRAVRVSGDIPLRCRLTLDRQGCFALETSPLAATPQLWQVALHPERLNSDDQWLRHKSTCRALYDRARADLPAGVDEWIFANERGEICEGTITNLFIAQPDGPMLTPALGCGLLPGVLRAGLLARGAAVESRLSLADLDAAPEFWVGNGLRGLIPARLVSALP